jgi:hypothetical protein
LILQKKKLPYSAQPCGKFAGYTQRLGRAMSQESLILLDINAEFHETSYMRVNERLRICYHIMVKFSFLVSGDICSHKFNSFIKFISEAVWPHSYLKESLKSPHLSSSLLLYFHFLSLFCWGDFEYFYFPKVT